MCGILITKGVESKAHDKMAKWIENRGNDKSKTTIGGFMVSHSRLALQSSSKAQPVNGLDTKLYLIGENYDYSPEEDIFGEIASLYSRLWTTKDWYFDWEGSLLSLPKHGGIHIFTDPLRKRPLFYYASGDITIICSDFKVFTETGLPINEEYMGIVQRQGFAYDNTTPLKGVSILPPGETIINKHGDILFSTPPPEVPIEYNQEKKIKGEIEKAVFNRIRRSTQSKEFSILLSGGTDSTYLTRLIFRYADELGYEKINAIVLVDLLKDAERNNISDLMEDYKKLNIIRKYFYPNRISHKNIIQWFGFPVDLGSVVPQIRMVDIVVEVAQEQDKPINVLLTGDGADEFFGGYKRNLEYDSRFYDIFIELIHYHNIRLDQIPFNNTIELRTPFQALPLLPLVLGMNYESRKDKTFFRFLAHDFTPKTPLKIEDEDKITKRKKLIEAFRSQNGFVYD